MKRYKVREVFSEHDFHCIWGAIWNAFWEIYGVILHYYQMIAEHAYVNVCGYIFKVLVGFRGVGFFKKKSFFPINLHIDLGIRNLETNTWQSISHRSPEGQTEVHT